MNTPLVSCIVPTFNSQRYLRESLESILAQTYRPIEVIIADDGSRDETRAIADSYGERLRWVEQKELGPAATRNLGLRASRGEFVAWLDPDDLWHPEKLSRQMELFGGRPELAACITHAQMFWSRPEEAEQYRMHPRAQPRPGYATTTLLARRNLFDRLGEFNTSLWFGDATDWFLRAAEHSVEIDILPEVLVYHRMHESNLTRRQDSASRAEFLNIVKASLDRRRGKQ